MHFSPKHQAAKTDGRIPGAKELLKKAIVIPFVLILLLVTALLWQVQRLRHSAYWVDHTDQVISSAHSVQVFLLDQETGIRGYLLSGDQAFLEPYLKSQPRVVPSLDALARRVEDNPPQVARARELKDLYLLWNEKVRVPLRLWEEGKDYRSYIRQGEPKRLMDRMRARIAEFIEVESRLRTERMSDNHRISRAFYITSVAMAVLIALMLAVFSRRQFQALLRSFDQILSGLRASQDELRAAHAHLERRVAERTRELSDANRELEAFSYSVSHDLRAPLRSMEGFSERLIERYEGVLDERAKDYLRRIQQASHRMAKLIDGLLTLSRVSRARFKVESVSLSELAESVCRQLRRQDSDRKARIEIAPGLQVVGDSVLLRLALENLLSNAWKFTAKRAESWIELSTLEQAGETVYMVRDNGAGFDMRYSEKLFEPFERLHSIEEFEGNGVGLFTVKRVIERHHGRIWAKSAPGEGAVFYFTIGQMAENTDGLEDSKRKVA